MDIDKGWAILKELTWSRVVIGASAGLAGLMLLYVYENLDTAIPILLANNLAMFGLILAFLLAVIGGIGGRIYAGLQRKLDGAQDGMMSFLHEQLAQVEAQQQACLQREFQSQKRMALMNARMNQMERALHHAGIRTTDFGTLEDGG